MGPTKPEPPLGTDPSPPLSPKSSSSSSNDSTLLEDSNNLPLSSQETSLLQQEYEFQTRLIHHYNQTRDAPNGPPGATGHEPKWRSGHGSADDSVELPKNALPNSHDMKQLYIPQPHIYISMENGTMHGKGFSHDAYAYQNARHRRPLIDLVTNQWRNNSAGVSYSPPTPSNPSFAQILSAPKFRRYIILITLFLLLPFSSWRWWGKAKFREHRLLSNSLNERLQKGKGWYGSNMRPVFHQMVQSEAVDPDLLPQVKDKNRLIVVGDVHGCYDELLALLEQVSYNARKDHIVFTGDLISKGPASPAVVELAIKTRASCVRGNHEDRVLLANRDLKSVRVSLPGPDDGGEKPPPPSPGGPDKELPPEIKDDLDEESFSHGDYVDRKLAQSLSQEQIDYLAACPVVLDLGKVKGMGEGKVHVAHAGLIPGVTLENQDPLGVMHMRTIDLDTHVPSRESEGMVWFKLWDKYQRRLPRSDRSIVIYGHDSKRGLQLNKYSKGLDTGCVKGGQLTALLITEKEQKVHSVKCKDYSPKRAQGNKDDDLPFLDDKKDGHKKL
ncbi:MAG: hypothetical protein Q9214_003266 [Letrouitia sp. 1 TL-2023]